MLTCRVSTLTPWLRVVTPEVRARVGRRARVRYEVNPGALAVGEHRGLIRLEASPSRIRIAMERAVRNRSKPSI